MTRVSFHRRRGENAEAPELDAPRRAIEAADRDACNISTTFLCEKGLERMLEGRKSGEGAGMREVTECVQSTDSG